MHGAPRPPHSLSQGHLPATQGWGKRLAHQQPQEASWGRRAMLRPRGRGAPGMLAPLRHGRSRGPLVGCSWPSARSWLRGWGLVLIEVPLRAPYFVVAACTSCGACCRMWPGVGAAAAGTAASATGQAAQRQLLAQRQLVGAAGVPAQAASSDGPSGARASSPAGRGAAGQRSSPSTSTC